MRLQAITPIAGIKKSNSVSNNKTNSSKLCFKATEELSVFDQVQSTFISAVKDFSQTPEDYHNIKEKKHGSRIAAELKSAYVEHKEEFEKAVNTLTNHEGKRGIVIFDEGEKNIGAVTENVLEGCKVYGKFIQKCISIVNNNKLF